MNNIALTVQNTVLNLSESLPLGISRFLVLGFFLSKFLSTIRLKDMAEFRAVTIAKMMRISKSTFGLPWDATKTLDRAKGSANTACSILIMRNVRISFCQNDVTVSIFLKFLALCLIDPKSGTRLFEQFPQCFGVLCKNLAWQVELSPQHGTV